MNKVFKEWFIQAPWGKIAMMSCGNPKGAKVLLVHGGLDNAATFIPLLNLLPDEYHYVAFDMPGHGKSDPLPYGMHMSRIYSLPSIEIVIQSLNWESFIYISHSLSGEYGLLYNAARPNVIQKFIHLDIAPPLRQAVSKLPFSTFFQSITKHYNNYQRYNVDERIYTKREALDAVMSARKLTENQAEIVLSRNLHSLSKEEDKYILTWDKRFKIAAGYNSTYDQFLYLFTTNVPPTLFILASESVSTVRKRENDGDTLIKEMQKRIKDFKLNIVDGSHHLHLTNPEKIVELIKDFLKTDFPRSKL